MRPHLLLPLAALFIAISVRAEELESATFEEDNFKATWSRKWERLKPTSKLIQLVLQRNPDNAILVGATKADLSLEGAVEGYDEEQKLRGDKAKEVSRKPGTVAGERALTVKTEQPQGGGKLTMYVTIFNHQGIAYRIVGVSGVDDEDFKLDYKSFLKRFAFIAERKEWVEQYEGKPGRTALLGGLVSFELNRPRWTEDLPQRRDYEVTEEAGFHFLAGGAWLNVTARESSLDFNAELAEMRRYLSQNFKKVQESPVVGKVGGKEVPCIGFTAESQGLSRQMRGTVFVQDGLAVRVWLESLQSATETTQRDWDQVLGSFVVQSPLKPAEEPAYAWKRESRMKYPPNPTLARVLSGAARLKDHDSAHLVHAVSPDGKHVLVGAGQNLVLEDFASGERETLNVSEAIRTVAWSRDGKRLAWPGADEITVLDIRPFRKRTLKIQADHVSFGAQTDELLIVTALGKPRAHEYELRAIEAQRIEAVKISDGSRRTVLEFPLSSFGALAVSPDGTKLALWCNHDAPRTKRNAGGIYLCDIDGKNLRPLLLKPHTLSALSWSSDGSLLYAVIRPRHGWDDSSYGGSDIVRIPINAGKPLNLTRCQFIANAWTAGEDVFLLVSDYRLDQSQRGLFRITAANLAAASAEIPEPEIANPEKSTRAIADAVLSAAGKKDVREIVPTPELMQQLATAFAAAASPLSGPLDFSAASLDMLNKLSFERDFTRPHNRAFLLGLGAYYGETLRRCRGARWVIARQRFGDWLPGGLEESNTLVESVLPFSSPLLSAAGSEAAYLRRSDEGQERQQPDRQMILVYPPWFAKEALEGATDDDYRDARRKLDSGDVDAAVPLYLKVLQKLPHCRSLAKELIELCEVTSREEMARDITAKAVENGTEVQVLLLRHADALLKEKPDEALKIYRKAASQPWPGAEVFLKLGRIYTEKGQSAVAESCLRRANEHATPAQKKEIRTLMKLPEDKKAADNKELDLGE